MFAHAQGRGAALAAGSFLGAGVLVWVGLPVLVFLAMFLGWVGVHHAGSPPRLVRMAGAASVVLTLGLLASAVGATVEAGPAGT